MHTDMARTEPTRDAITNGVQFSSSSRDRCVTDDDAERLEDRLLPAEKVRSDLIAPASFDTLSCTSSRGIEKETFFPATARSSFFLPHMPTIEEQIVAELGPVFDHDGDDERSALDDAEFAAVGPTAKSKFGAFVWPSLKAFMSSLPDECPLPRDLRVSLVVMLVLIAARLPCPECKQHFTERVKRVYPHTRSRGAILKWICNVENEVRVENGKEPFSHADTLAYLHSMAHRSAPARLPVGATPIAHADAPAAPKPAPTAWVGAAVACLLVFGGALLLAFVCCRKKGTT